MAVIFKINNQWIPNSSNLYSIGKRPIKAVDSVQLGTNIFAGNFRSGDTLIRPFPETMPINDG